MSFGGGTNNSISSANDVALSNPANLQVLGYNSTLAKWQNIAIPAPVTSVNNQTGAVTLTKSDIGLSSVDNTSDVNKPVSAATQTALNAKEAVITAGSTGQYFRGDKTFQALDKFAVGLTNVDNTSDSNKPVSAATQTALSTKEPIVTGGSATQYYRGDKTWQTLDKTAVGLAGVDNTSDVAKPISSATQTALSAKEPTITTGTTGQYFRGDKTFQTLDKTAVGLTNVDNTSDALKPVSSATQTALNAKEPSMAAGTTGQYLRGDKTWQTLDKTAVGLTNVDNTSDANKPLSIATQTALSSKADASSVGAKLLLIANAAALPAGTPAGVIVVVKT